MKFLVSLVVEVDEEAFLREHPEVDPSTIDWHVKCDIERELADAPLSESVDVHVKGKL